VEITSFLSSPPECVVTTHLSPMLHFAVLFHSKRPCQGLNTHDVYHFPKGGSFELCFGF
jgi:hypothetical protein